MKLLLVRFAGCSLRSWLVGRCAVGYVVDCTLLAFGYWYAALLVGDYKLVTNDQ